MSRNVTKWTLGLLAVGCVLAMSGPVDADFTPKNSADFDWKYEMNLLPDAEDLDGNSVMDFTEWLQNKDGSDPTFTVSGGILTMDSSGHKDDNGGYNNVDPDQTWQLDPNISFANGWTFETRVKVNSNRRDGFTFLAGAEPVETASRAWLNIQSDGQTWGGSGTVDLGDATNSDDFHIFRVAQTPGQDLFSVWRDGVLLSDKLTCGWSYQTDRIGFSDGGDTWGGVMEVDYLRFTDGAYAPIPEPGTLVLLAGALMSLLVWRRR